MVLKILVLEDNADRTEFFAETLGKIHEMVYAERAVDAVAALQGIAFDVLFLDHDLGGLSFVSSRDTNTGSEVVRWLVANKASLLKLPAIVIHSHNHPEASNMSLALQESGFENVHVIPFSRLMGQLQDPSFLS